MTALCHLCFAAQRAAQHGAEVLSVRLSMLKGEPQAQLDGFKSRALRGAVQQAQRHLLATDHSFALRLTHLPAPHPTMYLLHMGVADERRHIRMDNAGKLVQLSVDAGAATLQLNDSHRFNTFSPGLGEDMRRAVEYVASFPVVGSVTLQGKGPHFSVGGNPYAVQRTTTQAGYTLNLRELYDGAPRHPPHSQPIQITDAAAATPPPIPPTLH